MRARNAGGLGRLNAYAQMAARTLRSVVGASYWHRRQGRGRWFTPGTLGGYYNDLTGKVHWRGTVDAEGMPLNYLPSGRGIVFATTAIQKGIGHWDLWHGSGRTDDAHHRAFLATADWLVRSADDRGGWPLLRAIGMDEVSPYSGMTQGEAISLLVRAASATGEAGYQAAARRAFVLLMQPVEQGGTTRGTRHGPVLEEYPSLPPSTVLNGWISGIFGLYDLALVDTGQEVRAALDATVAALEAMLPAFDLGFWSRYDLHGNIATPFYHALHVSQLGALSEALPQLATVRAMGERFAHQQQSRVNRARAVTIKIGQKLRRPPRVILR